MLLLSLLLTSCNFAPDYERPAMDVSAPAYKEMDGWKIAQPSDGVPRGKWWAIFHDDKLNALEDKVTSANQNLKIALAQYDEAKAAADVAFSSYFPTVTGNGSVTRNQDSRNVAAPLPMRHFNDYTLGASATYELDVWGRVRNLVAAGKDREDASAADLANIDLSLHAQLAQDYFMLQGYDAAQKVLDEAVVAYGEALRFNQNLHKGGAAAEADVDQAQTQLDTAKTQAADTHMKRQQLEHAIATLTGQMPSALSIDANPIHDTPPPVDPGLPSTLLERRPDIASAERNAAAAAADIGVARAAYFPVIGLGGSAGLESAAASTLFKGPSAVWSVGPSAAVTLFDAGREFAITDEAKAAYNAQIANYRQTVFSAYQEVEDNIVALRQLETEYETQGSATKAAKRNLTQARKRYQGGIVTYLEVVVAQNTALTAELNFYDIETRRMVATVALVKSLGGGWNVSAP